MTVRYDLKQTDLGGVMEPTDDGHFCLFSDAQAKSLADERRIASLETALQACVAYMKNDSGGYEVYRATLDAAESAIAEAKENKP